jgi:RNA polymerase sigma-70 factor (ECF subfamily)
VLCRGNAEQARELLQQTMIRVAKYARVFEEEEIFWKWLTALARSCWVDDSRKRNRYLAALQRLWNRHGDNAGVDDAEAIEGQVNAMVELLAEEDRILLTKKYVEGLSVRELAALNGCSEKAIESRLARARNRMKEIMQSGRSV